MRILFLGDVMGRSGRDAVEKHLPDLKERYAIDMTIVNGENAAHGCGITPKVCRAFYEQGVDCITTGNHIWDQKEILPYIDGDEKLLRPLNFPKGTPGRGDYTHTLPDGRKILIINAMGRAYMDPMDDPFAMTEELVARYALGKTVHAIFIDFHADITSEKMALAKFLDGKVSAVVGTHTHIPTADAHIFSGGTAYQTDAGMCGDYDSVIGMKKEEPLRRFTRKMRMERFSPADGEGTVCGTVIETDDNTGKALKIAPIRIGGLLQESLPDL